MFIIRSYRVLLLLITRVGARVYHRLIFGLLVIFAQEHALLCQVQIRQMSKAVIERPFLWRSRHIFTQGPVYLSVGSCDASL